MQRYFVNEKKDSFFLINKEDSYHIVKVMRMAINDRIEVIYDNTLYICKIIELGDTVKCEIVDEIHEEKLGTPKVIIAQSLVKEQKMDYILQKCAELNVYSIIPINTVRSVVKLDSCDKKLIRWNKILKEASEQSKRLEIPKLDRIMDIKDLINVKCDCKYICSVNEKSKTIKSVLSNTKKSDTILFVIGPEGGFSSSEEKLLIDNGFIPISLGKNVLRTETASLFILSAINYEFLG